MSNPHEYYSRKWLDQCDWPIAYVFSVEEMEMFMDAQDYDPLTDEELVNLPYAFMETAKEEFMDEVLCTLRPDHRS
jgi:hypothetical protein